MIEQVQILDDWQAMGHHVVILGRANPRAPRAWLTAAGQWEPLKETDQREAAIGFRFPDGALEALVAAAQNVAAPTPATERHLADAIAVRDRLLALVERPS